MDLLAMFQPAIKERSNSPLFTTFHVPVNKNEVIAITDDINSLVFEAEHETPEKFFYKQAMIHAYEAFYINYKNFPATTSWVFLLRNYHAKATFKTETEHMMVFALPVGRGGIFDKTVAFTFLNLAEDSGVDVFRSFFDALESFLKQHEPEVMDRNKRIATIASYVLETLPKYLKDNQDYDRRLIVLDFVTIAVKNLEPTYKKNLGEFLKLGNMRLTITEKNRVEEFRKMLKE